MTTQGLVTFEENKKSISKVSKILRRTEFCLAKKPFATASNAPPQTPTTNREKNKTPIKRKHLLAVGEPMRGRGTAG